jgi:hypothetical protein
MTKLTSSAGMTRMTGAIGMIRMTRTTNLKDEKNIFVNPVGHQMDSEVYSDARLIKEHFSSPCSHGS